MKEMIIETVKEFISNLGFPNAEVSLDEDKRKVIILIENRFVEDNIINILPAFDHVINTILKKKGLIPHVIDINYYRKERERIIVELAKAGAKKAMITKQEVELPPMNGYERRIVHMEITTHPELTTESVGIGKERHVMIKFVQ
ncbi:hypothetical protein C4565_00980 [Candidatus Parcubacteria bacterium]|jgi:spoIIIJ-associated protein|nr:MAG: hypothetical protein C4565_00980 [Candidatus Parcubacteria bacterium]